MINKPSVTDQTLSIAASALKTQQARMRIISENIANADSTGRTAGEDPYRRQIPVFAAQKLPAGLGCVSKRYALIMVLLAWNMTPLIRRQMPRAM